MALVVFEDNKDYSIENATIYTNLDRIVGQIFRLLPMSEEGKDWIKPTETLILELLGMADMIVDQPKLFSLVCKLDGMRIKGEELDFMLFRRTIFECCSMVNELKEQYKCQ